jgi:hypothetical protein
MKWTQEKEHVNPNELIWDKKKHVKPNELIRGVRKEKNKKWTQEKEHVTQMNWFETQKLKW